MSSILDVHDLTVAYHHRPVLWDIDLTVTEPGLVGVVGPNGSGKTTLIKAILGLVPLASGSVTVFDRPVRQSRRRIGYVPQRTSVDWDFPVSVLDLVLMGTYAELGWFARPGSAERHWAMECLERVGMEHLASRQIGQLSGGQQQRTFLARALAQKADLYFMDEPMVGVDAATEQIIFDVLRELRDQGKTIVVIHHDLRSVPEVFDQVALLNTRLIAFGPTEKVFSQSNLHKAYGGRLSIFEEASEAIAESRHSDKVTRLR